ncbi:MAG: 23S rRNA (Uridine(2479)-2'-O)-methyltransferase [Oscillospiraceae bacterium]|jgi:RNA methyltransferase, TrmH family
MPKMILSRSNDMIKKAVRLSSSAQYRTECGLYFLEGARLCADAAYSGVIIHTLLYTEHAAQKYQQYLRPVMEQAQEIYLVGPQAAKALSCTKTPQGIFCICAMPPKTASEYNIAAPGAYLALENLQDPANMGTILRTAEALGVSGIVLGGNCCDIYSPKVLRASMGAVFRLPFCIAEDLPDFLSGLNQCGFVTAAAVPDSNAQPITNIHSHQCVMVVGNEGNGLTQETRKACSIEVTIPMLGRAESLNASAAAAILIWEIMKNQAGGAAL